jgi:hypothetical protein
MVNDQTKRGHTMPQRKESLREMTPLLAKYNFARTVSTFTSVPAGQVAGHLRI